MAGEAGEGGDAGERTEAATPRRLQRAREGGQVALSREVAPALLLAAIAALLGVGAPLLAAKVTGRLTLLLAGADRLDPLAATQAALGCVAMVVLPIAAMAAAASCLAVFGQTGLLLRAAALQPNFGRLNPLHGLGRMFRVATLGEAARAMLKFAVVGAVAWFVLRNAIPLAVASLGWTGTLMLDRVRRLALRLVLSVLAAQALLAVLDVLRARLAHARKLRMSRQEVRREHRESEGDPQIKARIRRLRMQRSKQRMMAAVPRATVIVTNPTHYAVALAYERGSAGAPRVVAKGMDAMAARIREVAQQSRVPLIANPILARALWRVELDAEVPADLFQAVAEVIATVWRLQLPRGRL